MNKGWLELESDPGLFTLLVEDFGVEGVQVEEVYDLQKPPEGPVYGFIFLFKWIEERRSRRKITQEEESFVTDENIVNNIFFGQQIIANSCATHALVSVLMNTEKDIKLGDMLTQLKEFTKGMNPEDKGDAIGNMPDLARAHNKHARPEPYRLPEKQQGISVRTKEAFHFVSYVPIQGRLFELDGLKPYPIDHGPWGEQEEWTDQFFRVISERLGGEPYQDIRFNLMAVVPDRRQMYEQKLKTLKTNRQIVLEALQQLLDAHSKMVKVTGTLTDTTLGRHGTYTMAGKSDPICTRSYTAAAKEAAAVVAASKQESDGSECASSIPSIKVESDGDIGSSSELSDILGNQTDITLPLCIETKFSPSSCHGPRSNGSSTDTASEVASLLSTPTASNPNSAQCSPLVSPEKGMVSPGHLAIQQMPLDEKLAKAWELQAQLEAGGKLQHRTMMDADGDIGLDMQTGDTGIVGGEGRDPLREARDKYPHQGFTPKELLELLKNVENEISLNENNLREENEKRKKYKVDSCRRTHNYDQFIFTFLSMLAEQGQLGTLVEEHMLIKRKQGVPVGRLHRIAPKPPDKKRPRARPKKRR